MSRVLDIGKALRGDQQYMESMFMLHSVKKSSSLGTEIQGQCKRKDYYSDFLDLVHSHRGISLIPQQRITSKKARLSVKCVKGHEFLITLTTLLKGRFCPHCHKEDKALHREYVHILRQEKEKREILKQEQEFRLARLKYLQETQACSDSYLYLSDSTDLSGELGDHSSCTILDSDSICNIKDVN